MAPSTISVRSSATLRSSPYSLEDNSWAVELTDKSQIWVDVKSVEQADTPPTPSQTLSGWRFAAVVFV
jgi:hypothetical protein